MSKQTREEKLADLAFIRNYVIGVIATGFAAGRGDVKGATAMAEKLTEQEAKMLDILDKH